MYFRWRVTYTTTTTPTTTRKIRTGTTTTSTAAYCLFLLTFISLQHRTSQHRMSRDVFYNGDSYGMQQQQQNQQQQPSLEEIPTFPSQQQQQQQPSVYQDAASNNNTINSTASPTRTTTTTTTPTWISSTTSSLFDYKTSDLNTKTKPPTTKLTRKPSPTKATTTTKSAVTSSPYVSHRDGNEINSRNLKNVHAAERRDAEEAGRMPDERDPFLGDEPIPRSGPTRAASATKTLAWDDPLTLLRRRHVLPEKLQYTSELSVKQGRLMGIVRRMQPQSGGLRDVNQYLGLPYAEAPVGSRRFMPPGTPLPWSGLKVARHLPPVCPQKPPDLSAQGGSKMSRGRFKQLSRLLPYLKNESEDCLYLNLYVPREDGLGQSSLFPVLVYIHGESFEWNSGNPYDGSVLASYGEVIVVTVNYRLGVLGFLKPSINERTVANFGLLDQIAALHWIKENIAFFGGDRESVTLMGHNTGAACINYLMVSPVASGLFHRAILMSGSAMSDWAASNHSLQLTMQIAHSLACPLVDDGDQMIDCLRSKSYQDIMKISTSLPQFSTSLGPIVDGHVIPNQPYKVMGQYTELFSRYDLLFGITESEAFHTLAASALEQGFSENERDSLLRFYMQSRFDVRPDLALAATIKKYIDMYNNPIKATNIEHRDVVLDILSDARVVGPLVQTGVFHADVNPHSFMYVFGHNSAAGPHANLPHSIAGEELAFVFGAPLAPSGPFHNSYSTPEKLLSEAVMTYWTNFAKSGNPKAPWRGTFINLHAMEWDRYDLDWPEFNKRSQAYINIGIPPSIGYKYRQIYMNFWNKELPDELNQIAVIQQQPFLHAYDPPSSGNLSPLRSPGEVITGHMSKFGNRANGVEDPVRTLKQLLQDPRSKAASIDAETAAENMYNAPPTFGVAKQPAEEELLYTAHNTPPTNAVWGVVSSVATTPPLTPTKSEPTASDAEPVAKSESTIQLLIGLIVVFIVLNVVIYATFLLQKRRKKSASSVMRKLGGAGGILSYDGNTDDELKRSKHTTLDGGGDDCSFVLDVVRKSNTYEPVKTERSPINGYQIKRQLSCSTMDTHTKVCEWMAGGSNNLCGTLARHGCHNSSKTSKQSSNSPNFSSLRGGGSSSGGGSFQQRPSKVNVAVDATPQGRGQSILGQPEARNRIICQEVEVEDQELLMPQLSLDSSACCSSILMRQHSAATEPCDCVLPPQDALLPVHKHSRSDPVELMYDLRKEDEQVTSFMQPPDINVTSRDEEVAPQPLTPSEQLSLIKRRNYPKVLPNLQKRNSLPPNGLLLHQIMACGRQPPPVPPPRISTLGRKRTWGVERRCSGSITTSPVMVAQDCTVEEEEPQQIAENTLIVGPIVPKPDFTLSFLRRSRKQDSKDEVKEEAAAERAEQQPSRPKSKPTALRLPLFSFESQPGRRNSHVFPCLAHHTEAVYAIQGPANLAASLPSMPVITPTMPLSPANCSTEPNTPTTCPVVYAQSSKVTTKGNNNSSNSRETPAAAAADPGTSCANNQLAQTGNLIKTTTETPASSSPSPSLEMTASLGASAAASRIPQLQLTRSLNNAPQQRINHDQSSAPTTRTSSTATNLQTGNAFATSCHSHSASGSASTPSTSAACASSSSSSSSPSSAILRDSLSGNNSSSSSSRNSTSSSSSTGTVRTELKQK